MSRPAAPESETPETDAFSNPSTEGDDDSYITVENYNNLLEHSAKLERRLSLAQTEIKGHMRVEDDLQTRIAELEKLLIQVREEWYGYTPYSKLKQDIDAALKSRA